MYSKLFLKKCVEKFTRLPVGSIVTQENTLNNPALKILVVNGGISQETDLEMIKDIDRSRFDNIDGTIDASLSEKEKKEKQQLQDLLWSDPQANQGLYI
jgi:serine/threonine-protein phosphatase with EF-hand domain